MAHQNGRDVYELYERLNVPDNPITPIRVQWLGRSFVGTRNNLILRKQQKHNWAPDYYRGVTFFIPQLSLNADVTQHFYDFAEEVGILGNAHEVRIFSWRTPSVFQQALPPTRYLYMPPTMDPDAFVIEVGYKGFGRRGVLIPEML